MAKEHWKQESDDLVLILVLQLANCVASDVSLDVLSFSFLTRQTEMTVPPVCRPMRAWESSEDKGLVRRPDGRDSAVLCKYVCASPGERPQFCSFCRCRWELKPNTNQVQREGCLVLSISCWIGKTGETGGGANRSDKWIWEAPLFSSGTFSLSLSFTSVDLVSPFIDQEWLYPSSPLLSWHFSRRTPACSEEWPCVAKYVILGVIQRHTSLPEGVHSHGELSTSLPPPWGLERKE